MKAAALPLFQLLAFLTDYGVLVVSRGIVVAPVVIPVVAPTDNPIGAGGVAIAPAVAPAAVS